jgi:hypothetical protein
MDDAEAAKLKLLVNKLNRLALLNIETVMNLSTAMVLVEGLSPEAKESAQTAFSSIQGQIDILKEISEIEIS